MAKKNSSKWWEQKVANTTWNTYNSIEEHNKDLITFYVEASESIKDELYALAEKVSEGGELSRTEVYKKNHLTNLNKKMEGYIYELGKKVEETTTQNMQDGFETVYKNVGVQLDNTDYSMLDKNLMDELLQRPWLGSNYSKRLWKNTAKLSAALNNKLLLGLQQGRTVTDIAVSIHKIMGQGLEETHRLVRTESMHYLNDAALQRYKDCGIEWVQVWTAADERTCDLCGPLHAKYYRINKVPVLPLHPNCRCTIIPVTDEKKIAWLEANENPETKKYGANSFYDGEKLVFDKTNDYSIKIDGYSKEVNNGLSRAARKVAEKGSKDGCEHMYLVNLKTGGLDYYESNNESREVGIEYSAYADEHQNNTFAFVHNHNYVSSLSEADLLTPVITKNIPIQIAVQNDGVKYVAERDKMLTGTKIMDVRYEDALEALNKDSRSGKILPSERAIKREQIIIDSLIKEFYKKGVIRIDGRK